MNILEVHRENIPTALKEYDHWVAWKFGEQDKNGKPAKVPIDAHTGGYASVTDRQTQGSFDEALRRYETDNLAGIGFVFAEDDPFCGIDLDKCRNPETGEIEPWAQEIIERLRSYVEVSPSGTGVKIIVEAELPDHGRKNGNIEMYGSGRYFTFTGHLLEGFSKKIKKKPQTIEKLYNKYFKEKLIVSVPDINTTPCLLADSEIISKALNAANGDKFKKIWSGDHSDFPTHSEADLALCNMLAFWTGRNFNKIDDLFRQSGLMRDKWGKRQDYREDTIKKAMAACTQVYEQDSTEQSQSVLDKSLELIKADPKDAIKKMIDDNEVISALVHLSVRQIDKHEMFLHQLKEAGLTVRDIESLKKVVTSKRKQQLKNDDKLSQGTNDEPVAIKSALPNAPVSDSLVTPLGWVVNQTGIYKEVYKNRRLSEEQIAPSPVLIQGHLKNITDDTENMRLTWYSQGRWRFRTVDRLDIADSKSLVKHSSFGLPVTSVSASPMVEYLAAFEAVNSENLPRATVTHQMGWQGKKQDAFLWGKNLISSDGKLKSNLNIDKMKPDEWPKKMIFFKGHDQGEDELAKGFHKKGEFMEWKEIEPLITKYPLVTFAIYAALATPLLDILDAPIFIVDWAFSTSRGKTTALKIAGSCWGNPKTNKPGSIVKSWNATRVWVERAQVVLQSLPVILDDTKQAKNHQMVSQLLYDTASGQGRGRGSINGLRQKGSWKTILLSSGESKAVNVTAGDGGAHARVLSIWGSPFGKKDKTKAIVVRQLTSIIHKNYGHAGYRFVRYLINNRDKWSEYRGKYNELMAYYQDKAGTYEVAQRQCEYFAVIHLAAILAKKSLGLRIDYKAHLNKVFKKVIAESSEADRAKEALQEVVSWAISNKDSFWMYRSEPLKQPLGGWLGVWNPDGNYQTKRKSSGKKSSSTSWHEDDSYDTLHSVAFIPNQLHKFLKAEGYEAKSITRTWKDKGWLDTKGEEKGLKKKVSIQGERSRCYVIPGEVIDKMNH